MRKSPKERNNAAMTSETLKRPSPAPKAPAQLQREIDEVLARPARGADEIARARGISERRIAALIANREDVRNTPAWRDAVSENQMIDLMSRSSEDPYVPSRRRIGIDRSKHTRVEIRWYAIPNQNKASDGFLPMIEEDGRARGDTWSNRAYDKAEAEAIAKEKAHEAASRFVGDWNVVVKKGHPPRR